MAAPSRIDHAIEQFVQAVTCLPTDQPIENALKEALVAEREIRVLFASDLRGRQLPPLYLGLIDVFGLAPAARRTRARHVGTHGRHLDQYIFPVDPQVRRPDLVPSTVASFSVFQQQWELFTHGALSKMTAKDWNNVVAAGGSVGACLIAPYPDVSNRDLNEYYQSGTYASSDIDLFLWGLTHKEAEVKMKDIYRAVCAATLGWKVICVRKANTVSLHTAYPFRPIQIVLRLYQSPAEILAGFDIDAACCAYDGGRVWVNPRSLAAIVRQANTIDLTRRSPSYEVRLAKYAERGFEVYIPSLCRELIKPSLYSTHLPAFPNGLARLLVLEAAYYTPGFYMFLKYPKPHYLQRGSISQDMDRDANDLPSNSYDGNLGWAQIPYGVLWDAERIEKMVSRKDDWLNSPENPHNEGQSNHRHIFFAGSMDQCLSAFCPDCEVPEEPSDTNVSDFGPYIKGPIRFLTLDPGRQVLTGSFRPIEIGDWAREAYQGPSRDAASTHANGILHDEDKTSTESGTESEYTDAHTEFLPPYSE